MRFDKTSVASPGAVPAILGSFSKMASQGLHPGTTSGISSLNVGSATAQGSMHNQASCW